MKRFLWPVLLALLVISATPAHAQKKVKVVTTLTDLKSITELIGGDKVDVTSIATGYQNPHFVDPKPSYIVKLSRADMFVTIGLDLEIGWVPPLLNSARNEKILKGGVGYVDTSANIPLLQVPISVSREQGDIHIYGNPHYWLDPENGKIIAQNIYEGLLRLRPEAQGYFTANLKKFNDRLDAKNAEWEAQMQPIKGADIVTYHDQWPYFEHHFGLNNAAYMEPKPGIPPTPSQLAKVIKIIQQRHVKVIVVAPYYRPNAANLVARRTNAKVVKLASSVEAFKGINTYFDLFDYNVKLLVDAFGSAAP